MTTKWVAVKIMNYTLACSELLEHLAMNGYTYDTNLEGTIFIYEEELEYLCTMLNDRNIEYEVM